MMNAIAAQIKEQIKDKKPQTLIILGSGLGDLANEIKKPTIIAYEEIKGFPQSTVSGHQGKLIIGELNGIEVICMQGRFHLYEGHPPQATNMIIKAFAELGIKNMIVTNAAGSLNKKMAPGSIMLISDHINFSGQNPLIGINDDSLGARFPDMSNAYNQDYQAKAKQTAKENKIKLFNGTYLMVMGPNFETPAEIRAFQVLGANAVGMSTVPEVLSAVHSNIKVLGFSVITNFGTGMQKGSQSHEETLNQGKLAAKNLQTLVKGCLKWMM